MKQKMEYLLHPRNIAIIGASNNLRKSSGRILMNLLKTNFTGDIYVVNPRHEEILGFKSYPSVLDIETDIDLACIISPARTVPEIVSQCVDKGVKAIVILSGGFSENGPEGEKLEQEIKAVIEGEDIIVYGPNSPGFFSYADGFGVSFSPRFDPKWFRAGNIGLVSQGGTLARAILDANEKGVGFSYWFSPGNEIGLDMNDCFEFLVEDAKTDIILLVIESDFEEERFFNLVHRAYESRKPIIVLSIGKTANTLSRMQHHFGRASKRPFPWDAIKHPGIMLVDSVNEMVSLAWLFSHYEKPKNDWTIIFSWSGGSSFYIADLAAKFAIHLPDLSEALKDKLRRRIKIRDYFTNPLDITTIVYDDIDVLTNSLEDVARSDEYDYIVVIFPFRVDYCNEMLAKKLLSLMEAHGDKVFLPVFLSQGNQKELSIELIEKRQIPYFLNEYTAIKTLSQFIKYGK